MTFNDVVDFFQMFGVFCIAVFLFGALASITHSLKVIAAYCAGPKSVELRGPLNIKLAKDE